MEYIITTQQGTFIIRENKVNKGIKVFTTDNKPYTATAEVEWWDLDGVRAFLANVDKSHCKAV